MSASMDELPSAAEEQASSSSCTDEVFNSSLHRCVSEILQDPAAAPRNEGPVDRTRRRSHRTLPSNPPPAQGTKRRRPARFLSRVVSQDLSDPASIVINSQEAINKRPKQLVADTDSPKSSSSRVRIISPSLTVIGSPPSAAATAVETHQDTEQQTLRHVSTSNDSKKSILSQALLPLQLKALTAETMQLPLRPILAKLMAHPVHNRKGIFNQPVEVEGYRTVIPDPMDLGTIKQRLHANLYASKEQFAQDVQRVFTNAMTYNPPSHPVHVAAMHLLQIFEEAFQPKQDNSSPHVTPETHRRRVSSSRHSCSSCRGQTCVLCNLGCIPLEPTLLLCSGSACLGTKIKKGEKFYCTSDGNKTFCQDCYASLPSILPCDYSLESDSLGPPRYKRNLLKRKNEEEVVESWITCSHCLQAMHCICAFVDDVLDEHSSFMCPVCVSKTTTHYSHCTTIPSNTAPSSIPTCFTFLTGHELPEEIPYPHAGTYLDARTLTHNSISAFMEQKVQKCMLDHQCPLNAEKTIAVRIISDGHKYFSVPGIIQRHFRMVSVTDNDKTENTTPPSHVSYSSKAIALFQKFDGLDVCIFCLYVQEYGNMGEDGMEDKRQHKRVYIAYLDSVDYFRPRHCRTDVYQTMLISYLATARARGYEYAHIWSCPPSRGNSFVFWSHPPSQKTPTRERLLSWYHEALSKALAQGVVTDIMSLYEFAFQSKEQGSPSDLMICPPLFDGDLWIEEACRIHTITTNRVARKAFSRKTEQNGHLNAATQIAHMLSHQLMTASCAHPFLRPVNAAALKLLDYHDIIKKPMDLSTIYSRCLLGEYNTVRDVVSDVKLVVDNAKVYNPSGHPVHSLADDLWQCFETHLNSLCLTWHDSVSESELNVDLDAVYEKYLCTSLKLLTTSPLGGDIVSITRGQLSSNTTDLESRHCGKIESLYFSLTSNYASDNNLVQRMVGEDTWLLAKGKMLSATSSSKKSKLMRMKRPDIDASLYDANPMTLSASWLTDEVSRTMRRMRRDFFVCKLQSNLPVVDSLKEGQLKDFSSDFLYEHERPSENSEHHPSLNVADSRFALLEFSQCRRFQFDTLRRAKYSTSMILYYIYNPTSPGIIPKCSSCRDPIQNVRWHRFKTIANNSKQLLIYSGSHPCGSISADSNLALRDELCDTCYSDIATYDRESFVPIRVTSVNN